MLSLAPRVFRVRLYRAVNGEQKALGAHAPALSFSIYRLSSLVLFSFFLSFCPTRHADHRGPLSPTPRNLQPPSVFRSSGSPIRAADRPAFSTTAKGEAADDQRDRRNQTIKSLSSTELNRDVPWSKTKRVLVIERKGRELFLPITSGDFLYSLLDG